MCICNYFQTKMLVLPSPRDLNTVENQACGTVGGSGLPSLAAAPGI